WQYAFGALYLFTINTIFIGLATFLVLKILRFPMVRYANSKRRRLVAQLASLLAIAVMIPAGYTFYKVWQESVFKNQAKQFISETIKSYQFSEEGRFLENLSTIYYNDGVNPLIELVFMGDERIPVNVINTWKIQKEAYSQLLDTDIKVVQGGKDESEEKFKYISELYETKKEQLVSREERIKILEEEVARLTHVVVKQIPFSAISEEAHINYENLEEMGFSYEIKTNFVSIDTIPLFTVKWKDSISVGERDKDFIKLEKWLKLKLKDPEVVIKRVN